MIERLSRPAATLLLLATPLQGTPTDGGNAHLAEGDAAWERRAEGQSEGRAAAVPIESAIAAYEAALAASPDSLEARWKLARALFYLGEHVLRDRDARLEVFLRGRELGEEGLEQLGGEAILELNASELRERIDADPTEAAEVLFWSAAHWGLWGRTRGKLASAREGVGSKVRDRAQASVWLDPKIENGGGHRILGRLHTEAPKIPFVTGWIDRETAVAELETCLEIAPDDLTTRYYLGEALVEFEPRRREEGLDLLREVVASEPHPGWLLEEMQAIREARALLERLEN